MQKKTSNAWWSAYFWIFGVITCAYYAYVTELICSQSSYLWAVCGPLLLIAPANAAILFMNDSKPASRFVMFALGALNGIALVVSSILFLVLLPLILMASIGFGIGICSLNVGIVGFCVFYWSVAVGPVVSAVALRSRFKRSVSAEKGSPWVPISTCVALVLSAIFLSIFPTTLTKTCSAAVANQSMLPEGLLLLRALGNEEELLRACYSEESPLPWFFQPLAGGYYSNWFWGQPDTKAREIYYRVNGKPFNSVPRPSVKHRGWILPFDPFGGSSEDYDNEYTYQYDHDFAGEAVGGIVPGLTLDKSYIGGWVDPNETVAHLNWTMVFDCPQQDRELRAQILLPPHAVVDRCTLWVKGLPHEAVIATRESSRKAYTETAYAGETPLMVSTAGAGRVLLQSSTGWWGRDAKLRIEITSPLTVLTSHDVALPMPMFTERNFSVPEEHQISLTSTTPADVNNKAVTVKELKSSLASAEIDGKLTNAELSNGSGTIFFQRKPPKLPLAGQDPSNVANDFVQQTFCEQESATTPLLIVLDGSSTMANWMNLICDALTKVDGRNATIVWASDVPKVVVSGVDTNSGQWRDTVNRLRDSASLGGQNNAEALSLAIAEAGSKVKSNIVWLHGPQPAKFSGNVLLPMLENSRGNIKLYEYQMIPGPNEVIKSLDQTDALVQVPHLSTPAIDLETNFQRLSGKLPVYAIQRSYVKHGSIEAAPAKHIAEIAQLYASDQVFENIDKKSLRSNYGRLAEQHHIVTPITSALVLQYENYADHGVTTHSEAVANKGSAPASISHLPELNQLSQAMGTIPAKPEPPMSPLLGCVLILVSAFLWTIRRRQKHA